MMFRDKEEKLWESDEIDELQAFEIEDLGIHVNDDSYLDIFLRAKTR